MESPIDLLIRDENNTKSFIMKNVRELIYRTHDKALDQIKVTFDLRKQSEVSEAIELLKSLQQTMKNQT